MKLNLLNVKDKINLEDYSLKEISRYFEKFHNFMCKIETENFSLKFKIDKYALPHILGLQYAYANKKDSKEYKGKKGFEKLINGQIEINNLKNSIKTNTKSEISWKNVKRRMEYLPMFLNTIENGKTRFKIMSINKIFRNTSLKGSYALFKMVSENGKTIYPMFSLKETNNEQIVIETFIVEDNINLLVGLDEEKIMKLEFVSPLENTLPKIVIKNKDKILS